MLVAGHADAGRALLFTCVPQCPHILSAALWDVVGDPRVLQ